MRLINKLKRLVGIDVYEYTIFYTDPLSIGDRTKLANNMINKFYFDCSPNRISCGLKGWYWRFKDRIFN